MVGVIETISFNNLNYSFIKQNEHGCWESMQQNPQRYNSQHSFHNGFPRFDDISVLFFFWENHLNFLIVQFCSTFETEVSLVVIKLDKFDDLDEWFSKHKQEQRTPNMCWTSSIKMILDRLSEIFDDLSLRMSVKDINRICKYDAQFAVPPGLAVPALNNKLEKLGYVVKEREGKDRFKELRDVLFDEESSLPIVGFGPKYIKDLKGPNKSWNVPGANDYYDHVVVVTGINAKVKFVDPMVPFLLKSSRIDKVDEALPKPKFLYYWRDSRPPFWYMWIEKKYKKAGPLDKWLSKEKVDNAKVTIKI